LVDLGNAILSERHFVGGPKQVARNVYRSDDRFFYEEESDLIGLVEWKEDES